MVVTDANYCFRYVDIGAYGSNSDSGIFTFLFSQLLRMDRLNLPENKPLTGTNDPPLPSVFVGNEAFALSDHLLCPYSGHNITVQEQVFNCRLTRARRVVGCALVKQMEVSAHPNCPQHAKHNLCCES